MIAETTKPAPGLNRWKGEEVPDQITKSSNDSDHWHTLNAQNETSPSGNFFFKDVNREC